MFFKTLRDLARPQIVAIFDVLKRSDGLAVGDLAEALNMSYMGVKQYCLELEKRGYLDTWRRAKEMGRPELTYRLTPKAQFLFPQLSNELSLEILDAVRQLHGSTAAEKILYQYFLKKSEAYAKKMKGKSLIERATALAKLRENEGYCAQVDYDPKHGLRLTEYHSPLAELVKAYPSVARMEEAMLSRLLQAPVQRDLSTVSGLMRITFLVAGATLPPTPPTTIVRRLTAATRKTKPAAEPAEPAANDSGELVALAATPADSATEAFAATEPTEDVAASEPTAGVAASAIDESTHAAGPTGGEETMDLPPAVAVPAAAAVDMAPPSAWSEEPAPATSDHLDDEPMLFAPPPAPAPLARSPGRTVTPARPAAKQVEPVAEELFLSL